MNHLPIDPDEAPWTEEYAEFNEARSQRRHLILMEQAELDDWERHNCRIAS